MYIKIHESYRTVVAICDNELIGKTLEQGKFHINVKENFFKGKKISKEEAIKTMRNMEKEDATFNIIGEKSIQVAIESGIITDKNIKKIQNIPFTLILL